jgi:hypothetical protein
MSTESKTVYGVSEAEWESAFHRSVQEFGATRVVVFKEGSGFIRVAFGNGGPPIDEVGGRGTPVYSHAVTITPAMALDLSEILRGLVAAPENDQKPK